MTEREKPRTNEDLCAYSDLEPSECAHCAGLPALGIEPELRHAATNGKGRRIWPPLKAQSETPGDAPAMPDDWAANANAGECRCGKPTRDSAYLCEDCGDLLARTLGDMAWLDEQLEVTITRQHGIPTEGGPRGTETPLPWQEKAADARRILHGLLVMWVRFCSEERIRHQSPNDDLPDDTIPHMAAWLLWRVDGLALSDIGPEALDEIIDAAAGCYRIINSQPERWYAGPCNAVVDEDGNECGVDLYARRTEGNVECRECHAVYAVRARRDWLLAAAEDRLADAATIARSVTWLGALPLTAARVRKWAERGRIVAKGHDGTKPLYRIGDAIDMLAADTSRAG